MEILNNFFAPSARNGSDAHFFDFTKMAEMTSNDRLTLKMV